MRTISSSVGEISSSWRRAVEHSLDRLVQAHALIYDSIVYDVLVYRQYVRRSASTHGAGQPGATCVQPKLTGSDLHGQTQAHRVSRGFLVVATASEVIE